MSSARRITGIGLSGLGLVLSFLCLGRAVQTALDRNPNRQGKREVLTGLLIGLPTGAGALWILNDLKRDHTIVRSKELQSLLLKAIRANNGRISAAQFAMLSQVSLDESKALLDAWASPLNADLDVDESGVVTYCFRLPESR
ncbi:hypothetical protein [Synechococcus sp. PCC 7335]|uniref:hypothetical protein n=1 Tax=Synechococcus sp. (strain ATCC 29403 / PCC 7335) TaxID=91464 RepID=UPI000319041E|nr:hypothetical protein [Synechococcus sp. PCC 7335]